MLEWLFGTKAAALPAPEEAQQQFSVPWSVLPAEAYQPPPTPEVSSSTAPFGYRYHDGDKFPGGFGLTEVLTADYWTLRARSAQLFETNIYARGIVRRLVTNVINTGLHLECTPEETILGLPKSWADDWTEEVERRFKVWAQQPAVCDHFGEATFGALQARMLQESLVVGDVLVILRQDPRLRLPLVQLVNGAKVRTPLEAPRKGNEIRHGVELDGQGRQVAYWLDQNDGTSKRIPAYGEKSGRRLSWLQYATDKRLDDVRGKPLLSLVLQSLREVDRYRDSAQRKAVLNSMLAFFVRKGEDKMGTRPFTGAAIRRGAEQAVQADGSTRSFSVAELIPGTVIEELQVGEEVSAFPAHGTDEKFGDFEEAMVQAVAWALEIPPEILRLSFSSNYSASQAAINEFKIYLNRARTDLGTTFCSPIYTEWLLSEVLSGRIAAPGFIEAWRDPSQYDRFGAWTSCEWAGHIKPAVDLSKLVKGYVEMVDQGFITRDRAARELTGTKYADNVKRLEVENEQLAKANASRADQAAEAPEDPPPAEPEPSEEPDDGGGEEEDDEGTGSGAGAH